MMCDVPEFQIGLDYEFRYPRHNFIKVLSSLETRRIRVKQIRDVAFEPLERETVEMQPLLKRGRILVTGDDLDSGQERSFYAESMRDVRRVN